MKGVKQGLVSVVMLSLVGIAGNSFAADVKIGVIDVQMIMQKAPEVQKLNTQLQDKFKPRQDKLTSAKKAIQAEVQDFTKNQAVMKPEEQAKLKNKILADQQAYESQVEAFRKDLSQAQNQSMQHFMGDLQTAVNGIAKKDQYNFILNRAAVPYMESNADITQKVLESLNNQSN